MVIDNRFVAIINYLANKSVKNANKLLITFDADISRMSNSALYKYNLHSYTDGITGAKSKLYEKLFDKKVLEKFRYENIGEKLVDNFQKFIWGTLTYISKEIKTSVAINKSRFVAEEEVRLNRERIIEQYVQFDFPIDDEIIELYRRFGKYDREFISIYLDIKLNGKTITETATKFGKTKKHISLILHRIKNDIQKYRLTA